MVKKYCSLFCILILATTLKAQVSIAQQPVMPMQFNPDDAWKLTVTSMSSTVKSVYLKAKISGSLSSQPIASMLSENVPLMLGANSFGPQNVKTKQIQYGKYPGLDKILQFKVLPFGAYDICVELYNAEDGELLGESCQDVEFSPAAPPVLVLPPQCEDPGTFMPVFAWFPPSPILNGYTVVYDLKLTEQYRNQSAEDAIQRNLAILDIKGLTETRFVYPATAQPLDSSKVYVWQVGAKILLSTAIIDNNSRNDALYPVGLSEVWCIRFDRTPKDPDPKHFSYALPKPKSNAAYTEALNVLRFAWQEPYVAGTLKYRILNDQGEELDIKKELKVQKGDNRYELDLKNTGLFKHRKTYTLEVTNAQGDKMYLRFLYKEE